MPCRFRSLDLTRVHSLNKAAITLQQTSLPGLCEVENAINLLSESGAEDRGAIFTRQEVVEFILDLVGYATDKPLYKTRILEPSFGEGDFLVIIVDRLLESFLQSELETQKVVESLENCIFAVELHARSLEHTAKKLSAVFVKHNIDKNSADSLIDKWLRQGDFLLADLGDPFTHVVGNPPYIRQELIPDALMAEYRRQFHTIYDRADLYVPFIEKSLTCLQPSGQLGFICADRWMKNRYGKKLRHLVACDYRLSKYVDMVGTQPFCSDVSAYPAIFVIAKIEQGPTRIALRPSIDSQFLKKLAREMNGEKKSKQTQQLSSIGSGHDPWLLDRPDELQLVRKLEERFPAIEDAGCKVGIGVATGADKAFIGPFEELDVEDDRKLPLVTTKDIISGEICYRGFGVVNPFRDEGGLVPLDDYPRLKKYFEDRKDQILKRHVSRKNPQNWYRTIDRIYPALAKKSKLLIPDIKGDAHVVYEDGMYYPHHNLYFVTSDEWNLRALQAVLSSGIAWLFVALYSTQMRGGYLRFQAQYLRRIRIPSWLEIPSDLQTALVTAGESGDRAKCNEIVRELYELNDKESALLERRGD
jgi:Eco57I restriction-modification methylase